MTLVVVIPGPQATVQDIGRPGFGAVGVPEGGAADRSSLRLANRLVGNPSTAAGLELLLGGLTVVARRTALVATTGAPASVTVEGRPMPFGEALPLRAGQTLRIGTPVRGLRTYLAVRGGIDIEPELGSRSASPTAGLGPAPLAAGDQLQVGEQPDSPLPEPFPAPHRWTGAVHVRIVLGPRDDWFSPAALRTLVREQWEATSDLDRVGVRLDGPALDRVRSGELASEGMVRGAVQVPPNGRPVVFLADHPTTGGYPVIGVVPDADTDRLAQLRPGDTVRFRPTAAPFALR